MLQAIFSWMGQGQKGQGTGRGTKRHKGRKRRKGQKGRPQGHKGQILELNTLKPHSVPRPVPVVSCVSCVPCVACVPSVPRPVPSVPGPTSLCPLRPFGLAQKA